MVNKPNKSKPYGKEARLRRHLYFQCQLIRKRNGLTYDKRVDFLDPKEYGETPEENE